MKRKASRSRVLRTRPRSTSRSTHAWVPRVADVDDHRRGARDGLLDRVHPVVAGLQTVVVEPDFKPVAAKDLRELMGRLDARAGVAQEYVPGGHITLCRHAGDCTSQMVKRVGISKRIWQRPGSCCEIPFSPPSSREVVVGRLPLHSGRVAADWKDRARNGPPQE
jgi:hypothetical protein